MTTHKIVEGLEDAVKGNVDRVTVISVCGKYRYMLRRTWDHDKPRALVIMLNPSIADAEVDDATIRALVRLLRERGYGSFEVVNVFGLRTTDPAELFKVADPRGPRNLDIVEAAIGRCDVAIWDSAGSIFVIPNAEDYPHWIGETR